MSAEQRPARTYSSESALRSEAVRLARYACNDAAGRIFGDPVFSAVTEGRQKWKGYSACGDLAHYVLRELGVRDERLLNRDDDGGVLPWKIGANLSKLVFNPIGAFVWATGELRPRPGDVLYVSKPEHVAILIELDETNGRIVTCEYGQRDARSGKPAGLMRESTFGKSGRKLSVGTRTLHGWLDLSRLPGLVVSDGLEFKPCAMCPLTSNVSSR